jgi:hypothetical protein
MDRYPDRLDSAAEIADPAKLRPVNTTSSGGCVIVLKPDHRAGQLHDRRVHDDGSARARSLVAQTCSLARGPAVDPQATSGRPLPTYFQQLSQPMIHEDLASTPELVQCLPEPL